MSDPAPIQPLDEESAKPTRFAVYDEAELRYLDGTYATRSAADEVAKTRNADNSTGRADGKRGRRFTVREV